MSYVSLSRPEDADKVGIDNLTNERYMKIFTHKSHWWKLFEEWRLY